MNRRQFRIKHDGFQTRYALLCFISNYGDSRRGNIMADIAWIPSWLAIGIVWISACLAIGIVSALFGCKDIQTLFGIAYLALGYPWYVWLQDSH